MKSERLNTLKMSTIGSTEKRSLKSNRSTSAQVHAVAGPSVEVPAGMIEPSARVRLAVTTPR